LDDRPKYWFGAKIGFGYRPPLGWRGWVAIAVWLSVWLAATPFMRSHKRPFLSLGFVLAWIPVLLAVEKWKGEP
jgi:hypothetical protein